MMKKRLASKIIVIVVMFLLVGMSIITPTLSKSDEKKSRSYESFGKQILYVGGGGLGNYSLIQAAIDNATDGDTIFVYDDSAPYYENILVNKSINLIGENRDTTILQGDGFDIGILCTEITQEPYILRINNFRIKNYRNGIKIYDSHGCHVINNNISNCSESGIRLGDTGSEPNNSNFVIENNILNECGIMSFRGSYNIIANNTITNSLSSIWLIYSNNTTIFNNSIFNSNLHGLDICFSEYINILKNNLIYNNISVHILGSTYCTISDNKILESYDYGIQIIDYYDYKSQYTEIFSNNLIENMIGLNIDIGPNNNSIFHNNFIDNIVQAIDNGIDNFWDDSYPSGGNYWSDFDETTEGAYDNDSDGIVDSPYNISGNALSSDRYPLIIPTYANHPPYKPVKPVGPSDAGLGFSLNFSSAAIDPENDTIYYMWDWGDGNVSEWIGPFNSGESVLSNHSWAENGLYNIRVKAKDDNDNEGGWSDPHLISIQSQLNINNIEVGYLYIKWFSFNKSYIFLKILNDMNSSVIISNQGLYIEVETSDAVANVTFELYDWLFNESIFMYDENSANGFNTLVYDALSGIYQLTVTAYDQNGTLIDRDTLDYLFYINLYNEEPQHAGVLGKIRHRLRDRILNR